MAGSVDLNAYVGREQSDEGRLDPMLAAQMGATLLKDWRGDQRFQPGDPLPQLWHWAAFPPTEPMRALGPDGHPKKGDFLPDLGLERRMWAGGALRFHQPLAIGERLTRRSRIASVEEKTGGAGRMVFVSVDYEISGAAGLAVSERKNIVYLNIPEKFSPPKAIPAPSSPAHAETVAIDPVLLFRYSAVTFNGHRIHYDLAYATEVENYPGLVAHGPLQATLLMDAATRWRGAEPVAFKYRGVHPMFHFHDLQILGVEAEGGAMELCTARPGGPQGMQATAAWG